MTYQEHVDFGKAFEAELHRTLAKLDENHPDVGLLLELLATVKELNECFESLDEPTKAYLDAGFNALILAECITPKS